MSVMEEQTGYSNYSCNSITEYRGLIVHVSFPIAIFLIMLLSAIQRTKKEKRSMRYLVQCRELFSLIYPLDLYDNHDRLAYCLAFGATSNLVMDLVFGGYNGYMLNWTPPEWSSILIGAIITVEISIDWFPIFACITSRSELVSNIIGFFYICGWFVGFLVITVYCEHQKSIQEGFSIIGPMLPVLICMALLEVYFLVMFIRICVDRYKGIKKTREERLMHTHQAEYVKHLLRKPKEKVYTGWRARVYKYYKPHPGFKYPTRVFMACTVAVLGLYQVAYSVILTGILTIEDLLPLVTDITQALLKDSNRTDEIGAAIIKVDQSFAALRVSWIVASGLALLLPCLYIPFILVNYRKHLLSMFSGRYQLPTELKRKMIPVTAIVGSLKYIGFQVGIFLAGYMVIQAIMFIFVDIIAFVVLFCMWYFDEVFVQGIVLFVLPSVTVGVSVMYSQTLFVRYIFLQDKLYDDDDDRPLAIHHKVWFLIYSFITMFLNTIFGLVLGIVRLIIGIILTVLYLPRIDQPLFMPTSVDSDIAYVVYAGNMYSENAHSHPILVTFCHLMIFDVLQPQRIKRLQDTKRRQRLISNNPYTDVEGEPEDDSRPTLCRYFRWHLAYTLINNPSLIELRKRSAVPQDEDLVIAGGQVHRVISREDEDNNLKMLPHIVHVMKRHRLDKKRSDPSIENSIPVQDRPKLNKRRSSGLITQSDSLMIQQQKSSQRPTSPLAPPAKPSIQAVGKDSEADLMTTSMSGSESFA